MSIRNLDALFNPQSIALIGASNRPGSIGQVVAHNLFTAGFKGPIMPVHPKERSIHGVLTYNSVEELPFAPDLAVIATPPQTIPGIIEDLGKRGTRGAVVISAGFAELGEEGMKLQEEVLAAARPNLMRIVGPNCLGILVPEKGINASFVHVPPLTGDIACIAQSGAVVTSIVDWATANRIGFSHLVSVGSMSDVDFGDMLDYLAADRKTRAVLLYIEAIKDARKFMSAARACARAKPVIVIKSGRSAAAAKAASSHTGALAGSDAVYDAAFKRAGMLRVTEMRELFEAAETLGTGTRIAGDRLAIVTNGGGIGVIATDALEAEGGHLAELSPETIEKLDAVLPAVWSKGNPVDIIGDAPGERYSAALDVVLEDKSSDAVLVMNCPTAVGACVDAATATVESIQKARANHKNKPVLTSWLGQYVAEDARKVFNEHKIPSYETPGGAVRAFMHLVKYRRNQEELMEVPSSAPDKFEPDMTRARAMIEKAMVENREWLTEPEAKEVFAAYGIPTVMTRIASSPAEAKTVASEIISSRGGRIAIKILSPDIQHKSDVGGVRLGLATPEEVEKACVDMLERISSRVPDARLEGFSVQEMAERRGGHELIIGMTEDAQFGPVLLFGQGGTAVEVLRDQTLALPPLNHALASRMIRRTRIYNLMKGYRDQPPADIDAVNQTLIRVSQLVTDLPEVAELDINPLIATTHGVLALDARIRVQKPALPGSRRLAIRPYPKSLEAWVELEDGNRYFLRPIRPEDAEGLRDLTRRMTPDDLRLRFFSPMREVPISMAARLTQIDYNREMALVAIPEEEERIAGIVRIAADPDNHRAEYAVMVESAVRRKGLGAMLMQEILEYARARGIREIYGEVLSENVGMLGLCEKLGFKRSVDPDDPGLFHVRKVYEEGEPAMMDLGHEAILTD